MKLSNQWNRGDKFTTPETGNTLFTVSKVTDYDVEAPDSRSASGYTIFSKSFITKVWEVENKYDTLDKIVKQLESCNYECEAGTLENNLAFISLKKLAGISNVPTLQLQD